MKRFEGTDQTGKIHFSALDSLQKAPSTQVQCPNCGTQFNY